uniref:Ribosomal protein L20 n=1 Tax=Gracilaria salicornia TaxID=172968 RepID=W8DW81_9FLOR|nr:ribosomal protein L20 [Gracilaria salicornia]AHG53099.1 ribosomal protein L20 [Gracilaria salicornia]AMR57149.1 ribosomal protein L20 [Gracilaria salicornia]UAD89792.1 ribosomal protein L20 [Gracilaria salicornia]
MLKKELLQAKSRLYKKRILRRKSINHFKLLNIKYNLFVYFISAESIILNKKILSELIYTEIGGVFSLRQWSSCFYL